MDYLEKCKQLVSVENAMLRAKYKLETAGNNYPDVLHDLAEVVNTLFEIAKEDVMDYENIRESLR